MRQGVRERVAALVRQTATGVRRTTPTGLVAMLCSGSLAPVVAAAAGTADPTTVATIGVLGSVGANVLSEVVQDAVDRLRASEGGDVDADELQRVLAARLEERLSGVDDGAKALRRDVAAVLEEIGAVEAALQAAIASRDDAIVHHVTTAFAALGSEFAEFSDLLRTAAEIQGAILEEAQQQHALQRQTFDLSRRTLTEVRRSYGRLHAELQGLQAGRPVDQSGQDLAPSWRGRCPYRGLLPFDEHHQEVFFGRQDVTSELLTKLAERLDQPSVVVVTGPSGVGKSSLLAAGLLPALAEGRLLGVAGSDRWPQRMLTPTARPLDELARCLEEVGDDRAGELRRELAAHPEHAHLVVRRLVGRQDGRLVLVVDQFEQVFDLAGDSVDEVAERDAFVTALVVAARTPCGPSGQPPAVVVLGLRADYWERCAAHPQLAELLQEGQFLLGPVREPELRQIVTGPAEIAGLDIETGLTEMVLAEVRSRTGGGSFDVSALPLVSQAMLATWENRAGDRLTTRGYEAAGGVSHAVRESADAVYRGLAPSQQELARDVFLRLSAVSRHGTFARRRAAVDDLAASVGLSTAEVEPVLAAFVDKRLLVSGRGGVEIAHEVLFDSWPRLRGWLRDDLDLLARRSRLVDRAAMWIDEQRDPSYLYRGGELAAARQLAEQESDEWARLPALDEASREFLAASVHADVQRRRRARAGAAALAVSLALALVLTSLWGYQRRISRQQQAESTSRALAALSEDSAASDPVLSMLQALAAYEQHPTPEAENALFRHYVDFRTADAVLSGARGEIDEVDASRDGQVVAARTRQGILTVWSRRAGRSTTTRHLQPGEVSGAQGLTMDLTDDGEGMLVANRDESWFYDIGTGRRRWGLPIAGVDLESARVSDDGFVALRRGVGQDAVQHRLELWDSSGGQPRRVGELDVAVDEMTEVIGFGPRPTTVLVEDSFLSDGQRLVLWDAASGEVQTLARRRDDSSWAASSTVVAICHEGGTVSLIDLDDGSRRSVPLPDGAICAEMVISADASTVVSDGGVGATSGWAVDVERAQARALDPFPGEILMTLDAVVTEHDRPFALLYDETHVLFYDVPPDDQPVIDVSWAQLLPDGERFLTVSPDGREINVFRMSTQTRHASDPVATWNRPVPPDRQPQPSDSLTHDLPELGVNDDGSLVANRLAADKVQVRRLPGLELVTEVTTSPAPDPPDPMAGLIRTRSDVRFVGADLMTIQGPVLQWWDPETGEKLDELDLVESDLVAEEVADRLIVVPYHDPGLVAVGVQGEPDIQVVDIETRRRVNTIDVGGDVIGFRFDERSSLFSLLRAGSVLELWDSGRERRVIGPLPSIGTETGGVGIVVKFLSEPGTFLLGDTGELHWYRDTSPAPERSLPLGADRHPLSASDDGHVLLYADSTTMQQLSLQPEEWQDAVCEVIERQTFSEDERATVPPDLADEPLC